MVNKAWAGSVYAAIICASSTIAKIISSTFHDLVANLPTGM